MTIILSGSLIEYLVRWSFHYHLVLYIYSVKNLIGLPNFRSWIMSCYQQIIIPKPASFNIGATTFWIFRIISIVHISAKYIARLVRQIFTYRQNGNLLTNSSCRTTITLKYNCL